MQKDSKGRLSLSECRFPERKRRTGNGRTAPASRSIVKNRQAELLHTRISAFFRAISNGRGEEIGRRAEKSTPLRVGKSGAGRWEVGRRAAENLPQKRPQTGPDGRFPSGRSGAADKNGVTERQLFPPFADACPRLLRPKPIRSRQHDGKRAASATPCSPRTPGIRAHSPRPTATGRNTPVLRHRN